jgi:hypothetical protein
MKRRNRKQELLKLAQSTKTYIDSLNLKESDLVITAIAAGVLGKHEVTLRAWRSDGRGPPYSQERDGAAVLYRVGDLWNWCKRNIVDPAMRTPEHQMLDSSCRSKSAKRSRYEAYQRPNDVAANKLERQDDDKVEVSK